jgi:hypothetical protein
MIENGETTDYQMLSSTKAHAVRHESLTIRTRCLLKCKTRFIKRLRCRCYLYYDYRLHEEYCFALLVFTRRIWCVNENYFRPFDGSFVFNDCSFNVLLNRSQVSVCQSISWMRFSLHIVCYYNSRSHVNSSRVSISHKKSSIYRIEVQLSSSSRTDSLFGIRAMSSMNQMR